MLTDVALEPSVLAALNCGPSATAAHIGVTADDGVVSLASHVDRYGEKHAASPRGGPRA